MKGGVGTTAVEAISAIDLRRQPIQCKVEQERRGDIHEQAS